MDERTWLVEGFEENRTHLRAVAYRMLGSVSEADDAVQEAWLRLSRSDTRDIQNLGGWLTTVVARVCLDMLRSRESRREEPLETNGGAPLAIADTDVDPEREAILGDAIGLALLVVLETLAPAERVAFVLHDLFAVPFDEIAPVVGRTPAAARQLASRARRRVRGVDASRGGDLTHQREIVDAFLAASRGGDVGALLALLAPEVVLRADDAAVAMGAAREVRGAVAVSETFSGRARVARLALVDGSVGAVWATGGRPKVAFDFTIEDGRIVGIDLIADRARLERLDVAVLA